VVLLDMNFHSGINNGNEGLYWLDEIKRQMPQTAVVLFTAYADIDLAVTGLKRGAALNRMKEILQHARDEQKKREKYFEFILDSVDTGILVVDDEHGFVLRSNKAALRLLGREAVTHINQVKDKMKNFSVRESYTMLGGKRVRIVGFNDIKGELAKPMLKEQCTLSVDVQPADLLVYADEGLVSRVVSNLMKNAAEAIGLSISRQIMRVSNGSINLINDEAHGQTIFRLTFP
jgi:nitrogen fixation/metabolism regulation signal transduction histidine kinase